MHDTAKDGGTRRFNRRAFASTAMAISGLALPLSGYANHVLQFEGMTVARHAWMSAHTSLGVLFTGFAAWHVALNWRPLLAQLRSVGGSIPVVRRETLLASGLVVITTALAVGHAFLVR